MPLCAPPTISCLEMSLESLITLELSIPKVLSGIILFWANPGVV